MDPKTYMIRKNGEQWCVYPEDGGESLGCHDTEEEAQAQLGAIEASKHASLAQILNYPIFRTGKWNGDPYSTKDLDEMVAAFGEVGFVPPFKLGHVKEPGAPAIGWIAGLRRVGEFLHADINDVPEAVAQDIKDRKYRTVSGELMWNLTRNGKSFPRVLTGLALLGADVPAVDGIPPAWNFLNLSQAETDMLKTYTMDTTEAKDFEAGSIDGHFITLPDGRKVCAPGPPREGDKTSGRCVVSGDFWQDTEAVRYALSEFLAPMDAGKMTQTQEELDMIELDTIKQALAAEQAKNAALLAEKRTAAIASRVSTLKIPALRAFIQSIYEALPVDAKTVQFSVDGKDPKDTTPESIVDGLVDALNARAEKFLGEVSTVDTKKPDGPAWENARTEADVRTKAYMTEKGEKDYGIALLAVLNADPDLKAAYAK